MPHRSSIRELPGRAVFRERHPSILPRVFRPPSLNHEGGWTENATCIGAEISGPARRADQNRVQVRSRSAVLQRVDGTADSSAVRLLTW